jgi:site-specific DNA-methyltransferase (adenine-specific)
MGKAFDRQHKALAGDNEGQQMQAWHSAWVKQAYRVLKPGGYLLAFGGSRTVHRLMSALEDAGFDLHPVIG